ncbi:MAG: tRNA (adenosine(37)-N6)-threonylcarbamoyltransferase complex transferase subunit TsaD [bacterium]|nr:tRNA (adenosine(37)-N6)-threonylcarbamoyltransferase complex transferase subunit TsaD [bacterium]
MKILAIDTSCDDTSVAVVEKKNNQIRTISNIVSSQIKIHAPYGGVYPMLAKREHQRNLVPVCKKALQNAKLLNLKLKTKNEKPQVKIKKLRIILKRDELLLKNTEKFLLKHEKPKVGAIAITNGPGLEPCLWQGVNFAKALAFWWDLPIIPVNHIKAHLSANWLSPISGNHKSEILNTKRAQFPAVGLVASGGHTELIYMPKTGQYKLIGSTRDDAAGECFDKTARILGLPYPGGPAIAALAAKKESGIKNQELLNSKGITESEANGSWRIELPRPMLHSKDFDFSFSGLKTAVLYNFKGNNKTAWAKEIQQAIIDVLIHKTLKAAEKFNAKSIIAGGGVMANKELRKQFKNKIKSTKLRSTFHVPRYRLCLDNAAMVGACALLDKPKAIAWPASNASGQPAVDTAFLAGVANAGWQKIKVNGNLKI